MLEAVPSKGHAGPRDKRATDVGSITADFHACPAGCEMPSPEKGGFNPKDIPSCLQHSTNTAISGIKPGIPDRTREAEVKRATQRPGHTWVWTRWFPSWRAGPRYSAPVEGGGTAKYTTTPDQGHVNMIMHVMLIKHVLM